MHCETSEKANMPFPSIESDFLDRLSDEAEQRTLRPQTIDWAEIHRQARLAREAS